MSLKLLLLLHFLFPTITACSKMDNGKFPPDNTSTNSEISVQRQSQEVHPQLQKSNKKLSDLPFGWELMSSYNIEKQTTPPELSKYINNVVTIRGFMIPIDWQAKSLTEFLLLPYVPSCSHVPPPGENQQILVTLVKGKKTEPSWYPFEVTGELKLNAVKIQNSKRKSNESFSETDQMRESPYFSISATSFKEIKE